MTRLNFLRVALVWHGTIVREQTYSQTSEPVISVGEAPSAAFNVPAPGLTEHFEMFRRTERGYILRVTDRLTGNLTIDDETFDLESVAQRGSHVGAEAAVTGRAEVYEIEVFPGDWGLIDLGEVELFFQVSDELPTVAGRGVRGRVEGSVFGAVGISSVLHAAFLVLAFLMFQNDPTLTELRQRDAFASFMVDDVKDPLEEPEDEVTPSEDPSGPKAKGEEGKTGVDDAEIPESNIPKMDGEKVEEVDITDVGIHKAFSNKALGSGPLKDIFANQDGFDSRMQIAMAGGEGDLELGRGSGFGIRGTGRGGGGDTFGTIQSVGGVDGNGKTRGAKIAEKKERKVEPIITPGTPQVGDFCDRNDIRRVVHAKQNAVKYCFENELQSKPDLSGKVVAQWQVGLDGKVMSASIASSTLGSAKVEGCITRVLERMRFQAPDGGICVINYPFVFSGLE